MWEGFGLGDFGLETKKEAEDQERKITDALARPPYQPIEEAFEKMSRPSHDSWWFRPIDKKFKSLRDIARAADKLAEFDLVYPLASEVAHGTSYKTGIRTGAGSISLVPIRFPEGFEILATFSLSVAFDFYRLMLETYRSGEETNFARKYVEEWQQRFMKLSQR